MFGLIGLICVSRCWQNPIPGQRFPREPGKGVESTDPAEWYLPLHSARRGRAQGEGGHGPHFQEGL